MWCVVAGRCPAAYIPSPAARVDPKTLSSTLKPSPPAATALTDLEEFNDDGGEDAAEAAGASAFAEVDDEAAADEPWANLGLFPERVQRLRDMKVCARPLNPAMRAPRAPRAPRRGCGPCRGTA